MVYFIFTITLYYSITSIYCTKISLCHTVNKKTTVQKVIWTKFLQDFSNNHDVQKKKEVKKIKRWVQKQ